MAKPKTPLGWISLHQNGYKGMTHIKVDTIVVVSDNTLGPGSIIYTNDSKSYPVAGSASEVLDAMDKANKLAIKETQKFLNS
jgi:hypothetical protein